MKLEKVFWEMIYNSVEVLAPYDFLKLYFRKCTNINNDVTNRRWFDDEDQEEQWGYGYRENMMAHFKQDLYNKIFTFQDQVKNYPTDTLQNRNKIWFIIINNDQGPIADNF